MADSEPREPDTRSGAPDTGNEATADARAQTGHGRDEPSSSTEGASATAEAGRAAPEAEAGGRYALVWRVVQGVDYLFYLLYALLITRFTLALLGASEGAGFVRFIHNLTEPFYAPFRDIVSRPGLDGGYVDLPLVLAILAYVVLHIAIHGLIRVVIGPRYSGRT